jgi:hypothetical protein
MSHKRISLLLPISIVTSGLHSGEATPTSAGSLVMTT